MYTISVRECREQLRAVLGRARDGHVTVVTSHREPIATIGPLSAGIDGLDALIASARVRPPRRRDRWRAGDPVPFWAEARIDQAVRDVRG